VPPAMCLLNALQPTPHLLSQLLFECSLVPVQCCFSLCKLILLKLEGQLRVSFECGDVVLLFIQQMLHFLLVDLQADISRLKQSGGCQHSSLLTRCDRHCGESLPASCA